MSMRDYAVHGYGILLGEQDLKAIAQKLYNDCTEETWKTDRCEFIEGICDKLGIEWISNFTGDAYCMFDDGYADWREGESFCDETVYYYSAVRYPTMFCQAYRDMTELLTEFSNALGEYLPPDFDYRGHLRIITGTCYG